VLRYAIIGFGGLGKKHFCNLMQLEKKCKNFTLAAICGTTEAEAKKAVSLNLGTIDLSEIDLSHCHFYQDYKEMIETEKLDFIISTVPTYLHKEIAVYALSKGIHVFSEKPMALTLDDCEAMLLAAQENKKQLMIGQCLRFHPAYKKVKEFIDSGVYGKVRSAYFERISQLPRWTWNNWILDPAQSGGCILDMHIHDVDLINWFFETPSSLRSTINSSKVPQESVCTQYDYKDFTVLSRADWSLPQTFPFSGRCQIDFEKASVSVANDRLSVYTDEDSYSEDYDPKEAFVEEMEAFLELVLEDKPCDVISPESVYNSVKIAIRELESGMSKQVIYL